MTNTISAWVVLPRHAELYPKREGLATPDWVALSQKASERAIAEPSAAVNADHPGVPSAARVLPIALRRNQLKKATLPHSQSGMSDCNTTPGECEPRLHHYHAHKSHSLFVRYCIPCTDLVYHLILSAARVRFL
ncbi:uncharacterized protein BO96DRAFT_436136 [Aspergillus niger CBS 101883]|uniref:uncharacterized protein n=1 Tax=Aspergillus lacticoffeatus (strain CBS 101883) TaxID=1450533 RepID=UPI000D7F7CC4|nr:uncharacterized protein BO96DRAFT_436136 [Aspergillus niger CBS 101883]PYH54516.1 hypothetical protein BO96DRAFT_436136 [Aspergillus niger CBS 101883]